MNVAICILAKDESGNIGKILSQLLKQSLLGDRNVDAAVYVIANGCSDDTADMARTFADKFRGRKVELVVENIHPGGKSRAWNRAVHEFIDQRSDVIVFLDADIKLVDDDIIAELVARLDRDPRLKAAAGYPIKDLAERHGQTFLDRFSLKISSDTRHSESISGQLYAARGNSLRSIWLPDETPGEDGFLNAMINTRGFTRPHEAGLVTGHPRPTHYYEAMGPLDFFKHERRLIVGTMINVWIFEHLMSLHLTESAGPLIKKWNEERPRWVEEIAAKRTAGKSWVIPAELLGRRLMIADRKTFADLKYLPLAIVASILTLPPAYLANRRLRETGAASVW